MQYLLVANTAEIGRLSKKSFDQLHFKPIANILKECIGEKIFYDVIEHIGWSAVQNKWQDA